MATGSARIDTDPRRRDPDPRRRDTTTHDPKEKGGGQIFVHTTSVSTRSSCVRPLKTHADREDVQREAVGVSAL
eukprot:2980313-Rhodomonas_salina.1